MSAGKLQSEYVSQVPPAIDDYDIATIAVVLIRNARLQLKSTSFKCGRHYLKL